jgi:hypothetical protein
MQNCNMQNSLDCTRVDWVAIKSADTIFALILLVIVFVGICKSLAPHTTIIVYFLKWQYMKYFTVQINGSTHVPLFGCLGPQIPRRCLWLVDFL